MSANHVPHMADLRSCGGCFIGFFALKTPRECLKTDEKATTRCQANTLTQGISAWH